MSEENKDETTMDTASEDNKDKATIDTMSEENNGESANQNEEKKKSAALSLPSFMVYGMAFGLAAGSLISVLKPEWNVRFYYFTPIGMIIGIVVGLIVNGKKPNDGEK